MTLDDDSITSRTAAVIASVRLSRVCRVGDRFRDAEVERVVDVRVVRRELHQTRCPDRRCVRVVGEASGGSGELPVMTPVA
ncbi:hypothetical protein [Geodermatophilus marinus]|uniref:hypothetical protein n=1 Tax=Geodermatophilus sp. LHW52908 TaxID=2303986 RepID=UPI000E3BCEAF|nr:hypothetical protein [Geodermatophilus sp. LHW52908]RFU20570.1 hypothetical protein D0Z06_15895 [Geodermatophilus sp. LHW52908]